MSSSTTSNDPNAGRQGRVVALSTNKASHTSPGRATKAKAYPSLDCPDPSGIYGNLLRTITSHVESQLGLRDRLLLLLSGQAVTKVRVLTDVESGECASTSVFYPTPPDSSLSDALDVLENEWKREFEGVDFTGVRHAFRQLLGSDALDVERVAESAVSKGVIHSDKGGDENGCQGKTGTADELRQ